MAETKSIKTNRASVSMTEAPVFSWKVEEFKNKAKTPGWFLIVSLVALALVVIFIISKNWTALGVVAAGLFALFSITRVKPKTLECSLFREGFLINDKAHRYADFKSFWLVITDQPTVRFEPIGRFSSHINMPIADEDPEQIRLFLSKFLPQEENRGPDFGDVLSNWLGF